MVRPAMTVAIRPLGPTAFTTLKFVSVDKIDLEKETNESYFHSAFNSFFLESSSASFSIYNYFSFKNVSFLIIIK